MKNNQELYEQEYEQLRKPDDGQNEYGLLVYSLEYVFKQAGYDITGKELAGSYHNQIVGMIGQSDFDKICQGFVANFTVGNQSWPPYELRNIVEGDLGYNYELARVPTIGSHTLFGWQRQVEDSLKAGINGKRIMRRGKRYEAWIAGKAEKACPNMLESTKEVIFEHSQRIADFIKNADKEDALAYETIAHYERTVYVIKAFIDVSGAKDKWGIVDEFERKIKILGDGLMARNVSRVFLEQKEYTPEQVLDASLNGTLKVLWDHYSQN